MKLLSTLSVLFSCCAVTSAAASKPALNDAAIIVRILKNNSRFMRMGTKGDETVDQRITSSLSALTLKMTDKALSAYFKTPIPSLNEGSGDKDEAIILLEEGSGDKVEATILSDTQFKNIMHMLSSNDFALFLSQYGGHPEMTCAIEEFVPKVLKCMDLRSEKCMRSLRDEATQVLPILKSFKFFDFALQKIYAPAQGTEGDNEALFKGANNFLRRSKKYKVLPNICNNDVWNFLFVQNRDKMAAKCAKLTDETINIILSKDCHAEWNLFDRITTLNTSGCYLNLSEKQKAMINEEIMKLDLTTGRWNELPIDTIVEAIQNSKLTSLPLTGSIDPEVKRLLVESVLTHSHVIFALDAALFNSDTSFLTDAYRASQMKKLLSPFELVSFNSKITSLFMNLNEEIQKPEFVELHGDGITLIKEVSEKASEAILKEYGLTEESLKTCQDPKLIGKIGRRSNRLLLDEFFSDENQKNIVLANILQLNCALSNDLKESIVFLKALINNVIPPKGEAKFDIELLTPELFECGKYDFKSRCFKKFNKVFEGYPTTLFYVKWYFKNCGDNFLTNSRGKFSNDRANIFKKLPNNFDCEYDFQSIKSAGEQRLIDILKATSKYLAHDLQSLFSSRLSISLGDGIDEGGVRRYWYDLMQSAFILPSIKILEAVDLDENLYIPHWFVDKQVGKVLGAFYGRLLSLGHHPEVGFPREFVDTIAQGANAAIIDKFYDEFYPMAKVKALVKCRLPIGLVQATSFDTISNLFTEPLYSLSGEAIDDDYLESLRSLGRLHFHEFIGGFRLALEHVVVDMQMLEREAPSDKFYQICKRIKLTGDQFIGHILLIGDGADMIDSLIPGNSISLKDAVTSVISCFNSDEIRRLLLIATASSMLALNAKIMINASDTGSNHEMIGCYPRYILDLPDSLCATYGNFKPMHEQVSPDEIQSALNSASERPKEGYFSASRFIELFQAIAAKQAEMLNAPYYDPFNERHPTFYDGPVPKHHVGTCGRQIDIKLTPNGGLFVYQILRIFDVIEDLKG